jgi:hypothetical protein
VMTAVPLSELSADADPAQSADRDNVMAVPKIGTWATLAPTDRLSSGECRLVGRCVPRFAIDAGAQKYNLGLHN